MLVNPLVKKTGFIQVLEIFDLKGFTPTNQHRAADEVFVVLHGQGEATLGADGLQFKPGSVLLLHPGLSHALRNTGSTRLDRLTTMVPEEGLARLITSGVQDALDSVDLAMLGWNF